MIHLPDLYSQNPSVAFRSSDRKKEGLKSLETTQILKKISNIPFAFAGTFPLNLQTPTSDIDLILQIKDLNTLSQSLSPIPNIKLEQQSETIDTQPVEILFAQIPSSPVPIEIYAADCPVYQQRAFVHMIVEARFLNLLNSSFRKDVQLLKSQGIKTEPAYGQLLRMEGDPFLALLSCQHKSDLELYLRSPEKYRA